MIKYDIIDKSLSGQAAMGRPRKIDEAEVLSAAMLEFWTKGYMATSTADLCRVTGLKPGSIYHRFHDKNELFIETLHFYIDNIVENRVQAMLDADSPIAGIEEFFSSAYEPANASSLIGCYLTNTSLEHLTERKEVSTVVNKGLKVIEAAFKSRVIEAIDKQELSQTLNPSDVALYLTSSFQGLMANSRLTKNKKRLRLITEQTVFLIKRIA